MMIILESSGGYLGIQDKKIFDTKKMSIDEGQQIEKLVRESEFFNINKKYSAPHGAADYVSYKLTIETDKGNNSIFFTDLSIPKEIRTLFNSLRKK